MTKLADVVEATAIRPFQMVSVPEAELTDLRRRINATQWPERETVTDASQGVQLATMQTLARYWATEYDWRKIEARTERPAAVRHRDRWARHSFHSRSFETRQRVAAHRHARMARLDHRADEDHRAADQSDGARRERIGRVPSGDSVDAGLRVFGQADDHGLGRSSHRASLGRADEAPRLHEIRGARRRLGWARRGSDGRAGARRSCSASTPTSRARFRQTSTKRRSPVRRHRLASRPRRSSCSSACSPSTAKASPMATRWDSARSRCTALRIPPSAWRPISWTTTP